MGKWDYGAVRGIKATSLEVRTKTQEHYKKFLDFWEDMDYGIYEVKVARKRLVGLKNDPEASDEWMPEILKF